MKRKRQDCFTDLQILGRKSQQLPQQRENCKPSIEEINTLTYAAFFTSLQLKTLTAFPPFNSLGSLT